MLTIEEIKRICTSSDRLPKGVRIPKSNAEEFIRLIDENHIAFTNKYVYALYNMVKPQHEYGQVYSIVKSGKEDTYDIEVNDDHSYCANGIIAHNTCNLPSAATEEEISDIYIKAWEQDCKGVTVYRDGCRSGVLIKEEKKNEDVNGNKPVTTLTHSAPKRPKSLPCEIKRFRNGGDKWVACVGLYNGEPYEIFTGLAERLNLPEYVDKCAIIKNKVDRMMFNPDTEKEEMMKVSSYDIVYTDKDGNIAMIEDVSNIFRSEFYAIAKLTSGLLRHGMPIEHVISTIKSIDFKNETINSWKQGVIRTLKKYLKDDGPMDTSERCPECGAKVVRENGCKHCSECGWSACQ